MVGHRNGGDYLIKDDKAVMDFFLAHKDDSSADYIHAVCTNKSFWGEDLSAVAGFEETVLKCYNELLGSGTLAVMEKCIH